MALFSFSRNDLEYMGGDWSTVDVETIKKLSQDKINAKMNGDSGPLIPFSNSRCICLHTKGMHSLGIDKCDNCDCSKFRLSTSLTAQEAWELEQKENDLKGSICVNPEAATPSQTDISQTDADKDRGSAIPDSGLKDSGKRLAFDSGMVRDIDDNKPAFDLIIPQGVPYSELMLTRWAEHMRKGAIKYSRRNWEKANSIEELERAQGSALRHLMQWIAGETDEDHAAAVFFNINEVETIRYKLTKETG